MSLFRYITKSNIKAHGPTKRWITATSCLRASKKIFDDSDEQSREAVKNLKEFKDKNLYAEYNQKAKGVIYDKKPFKYNCIAGKAYFWCTCGIGHKQPFCDGTHKDPYLKISLKPLRFDCTETKEYWFCNCKQTNSPPFCDGVCREL